MVSSKSFLFCKPAMGHSWGSWGQQTATIPGFKGRGGLNCLDRIVAKLSYSFIDFPKPQFLFYVAFFHDKRIHNKLHLEFFH